MPENDYLRQILVREAVDTGIFSPVRGCQVTIDPVLKAWGNRFLLSATPSGSFAKGTANRSGTDLDLFLSLSQDTPENLSDIHKTLVKALTDAGYKPRPQNVSIGIRVGNFDVDLVPGKRQNFLTQDHSLYKRRGDTWTKTDVSQHITKVLGSGRQSEIRLVKLWRRQKGLEFPSFYLELVVIEALKVAWLSSLADNFRTIMTYLRDNLESARFVDPANTNNIISDDLTVAEKRAIKAAATAALVAPYWGEIVT
jgi:hypothetical protein